MKSFIVLVSLVLTTTSAALACEQMEAQFSGTVASIKRNTDAAVGGCLIRINVEAKNFNSHALCPIDIDDAISQDIRTQNCNLKVGDQLATYLVSKHWILHIED